MAKEMSKEEAYRILSERPDILELLKAYDDLTPESQKQFMEWLTDHKKDRNLTEK